jgi:DNA-directed RNA polymerase specialized sigma subunit
MGRPASIQHLVDEFTDLTGRMNELKDQCRELADRREQVALQLSQTDLYLYQIGRMVGLSAPTLCRLAQKAREKNAREKVAASDGHPQRVGADR